jgi:predicted nucleic acid-binding protein
LLPTQTLLFQASCGTVDDDHVLACAIAASCDFIVTGDDDLLVLGEYHGIRIAKTAAFLAEFNL